ncbi:MAG: O-antigen ligase family protein [Phormidesmis sp.]
MPANHAPNKTQSLPQSLTQTSTRERLWLLSFVVLPYASYLGLVIMLWPYLTAFKQRGRHIWRLCRSMGFGWLTLGLLISSSMAVNRGESFLQLVNFLPFFLLVGVLGTEPTAVGDIEPHENHSHNGHSHRLFGKLEIAAQVLLLSAIPFMAVAFLQYVIKQLAIAQSSLIRFLPISLLTSLQPYENRVRVQFGNPNVLCAYLVILLGLGLGLAIQGLNEKYRPKLYWMQIASLGLCICAIFASGSRNGLVATLVLIAIALYTARTHRWILFLGLAVSGILVATAISLGFGERAMSLALFTQDARIEIWQQSLALIQQRPILGWGFTGFRSQYVAYSIQHYAKLYHAHNIWLFLASEAGVPVMLGFCFIVGKIYYSGVRALGQSAITERDRSILLCYLLAFTGCMLYGFFDILLHDSRINTPAWAVLAAIYSMSRIALNQPKSDPKDIQHDKAKPAL